MAEKTAEPSITSLDLSKAVKLRNKGQVHVLHSLDVGRQECEGISFTEVPSGVRVFIKGEAKCLVPWTTIASVNYAGNR